MKDKKKWYEHFIEREEEEPGEGPVPKKEESAVPIAAATRFADPLPTIEFQKPLKKASEEGVSFSSIYEAGNIQPPAHGFTILKVSDMLQSEHLKSMTSEVKKGAILVALEAANVKIDDVIQDAIKRDRALDAYEKIEERALHDLEQQKAEENRTIQKEIDEFLQRKQAQIKTNNEIIDQAKQRLSSWQLKKQREEQRIYDAVAYFVPENPITTSARPTATAPAPERPAPAGDKAPDKKKLSE